MTKSDEKKELIYNLYNSIHIQTMLFRDSLRELIFSLIIIYKLPNYLMRNEETF